MSEFPAHEGDQAAPKFAFWTLRSEGLDSLNCLLDSLAEADRRELAWITRITAAVPISAGAFIWLTSLAFKEGSVEAPPFIDEVSLFALGGLIWFVFWAGVALLNLFWATSEFRTTSGHGGGKSAFAGNAILRTADQWKEDLLKILIWRSFWYESALGRLRLGLIGLFTLIFASTLGAFSSAVFSGSNP